MKHAFVVNQIRTDAEMKTTRRQHVQSSKKIS